MTRPSFFHTRLGRAALISVAAMVTLNLALAANGLAQHHGSLVHLPTITAPVSATLAALTGELA